MQMMGKLFRRMAKGLAAVLVYDWHNNAKEENRALAAAAEAARRKLEQAERYGSQRKGALQRLARVMRRQSMSALGWFFSEFRGHFRDVKDFAKRSGAAMKKIGRVMKRAMMSELGFFFSELCVNHQETKAALEQAMKLNRNKDSAMRKIARVIRRQSQSDVAWGFTEVRRRFVFAKAEAMAAAEIERVQHNAGMQQIKQVMRAKMKGTHIFLVANWSRNTSAAKLQKFNNEVMVLRKHMKRKGTPQKAGW